MLDLNHQSGFVYGRRSTDPVPLGARINAHIDAALVAERDAQRPRDYLGASRIGEPCARRLVYEFTKTPVDPGKEFAGQTLRIFEAGHVFEDLAIRWLRAAGFDLRTEKRGGGQFGFETASGRIRGHVDGVSVGGPNVEISWPVLWEHKALKASSIRLDQEVFGTQARSALTKAFAVSMSLRMIATMATFAGFPAARRASYFTFRSGL